jgi:alpha-1,6-mannosyltransferase
VKVCDLTQFYSPLSGGVKRYVQEKIAFIQKAGSEHEHVLVIPGAKTECTSSPCSRIYTIRSPLVSRATQYRALLNLRSIDEIIERERPDLIESADPYQVGWKAINAGRRQHVPVVAFYHSHFAKAYLHGPAQRLGSRAANLVMQAARAYVRNLYNRFETTLVPSRQLIEVLNAWGVCNTRPVELGVNTAIFRPQPVDQTARATLDIPDDRCLLLYVGRLAREKNTQILFQAFALLVQRRPADFHLLVIGDGQQRDDVSKLKGQTSQVTWIPYCADSAQLAEYYGAADLFVHPGVEETFGLVALESQACGTPVIGFRGSYMDDVILHSQDSWATENTARALTDAIEAMSAEDLPSLGAEASKLVTERYAWGWVFERLFSVYHEVLSRYRRASTG